MNHLHQKNWQESIDVYNHVAEMAIQNYSNLPISSKPKLISYSENATYLITTLKNNYILRVSRPRYHTKSEIESELSWLQSIDQSLPITISVPIVGENNEFIQTIKLKNESDKYYCTMFTYLTGQAPNEDNESHLVSDFEKIGEIAARLHKHSIENHRLFKRTMNRLIWDYDSILGENPKWGRWQEGMAMTPVRKGLYEEVSETIKYRLKRFEKSADRFGLIHSDLRLANLLVQQGQMKVIDFDDCGFGWYLFDLAASLSFIEDKVYVPYLIDAWLKGYRRIRPISTVEETEIPTFIMMRRLQLVSWIGSRHNETTQQLGKQFTIDTDALAKKYLRMMKE